MTRWLQVAFLLGILLWSFWGVGDWVRSRDAELEYAEAKLVSLEDTPAASKRGKRYIAMVIAPSEKKRWLVTSFDWSVSADLTVGQWYRWGVRAGDARHEVLTIAEIGGREVRSQAETRRNVEAQRPPPTLIQRALNALTQLFILGVIAWRLWGERT